MALPGRSDAALRQPRTGCASLRGLGTSGCAGGDDDPYPLTFRNLDNKTYYMVGKEDGTDLLNYSGCGNTVSANNDLVRQMIVDSLRM